MKEKLKRGFTNRAPASGDNKFIEVKGSKSLKMNQAWKLTLKALEASGPSVDNFVENTTFFVDESLATEETPSPQHNLDEAGNESGPPTLQRP